MYDRANQFELNQKLSNAVQACDPVAVSNALEAHANPNARTIMRKLFKGVHGNYVVEIENQTPLHVLMSCGYNKPPAAVRECVRLLIHAGADIEAVDELGNRPIHEVFSNELKPNRTGLLALVEAGADVNAQGENGYTPLHLAACAPSLVYTSILLAAWADPRILSDGMNGKPPIPPVTIAQKMNNTDVEKALFQRVDTLKKKEANKEYETPSPEFIKYSTGLDLAKRKWSLDQKPIVKASKKGYFSDMMAAVPVKELDLHSIEYRGKVNEAQRKQDNTIYLN